MLSQKDFMRSEYYQKLSKHLIGKDVVFFDKIEELPFPDFIHEYSGFSINICRDGWAQMVVADKRVKMTKCDVFFVNSLDKIQAVECSDDFLMQTIWVSPLIMEMVHHECPLSLEYGITIPFFKACCPDDELLAAPARFVKTWPDEIKLSSASKPPAISDCCPRTKFSCSFDLLTEITLDPEHPHAREMVTMALELIFAQLEQDELLSLGSRAGVIVEAFKKELEKHYSDSRSAAFYAQSQCISVNYLNKCCNYVDGISTQECINRRLLFHAKRLLKDRKLIIKEVAVALGFPNLTSFSKFFRKQTGQSPTLYQRNSGCSNDVEE